MAKTTEFIRTRASCYFVIWTSAPRHYTHLKLEKTAPLELLRVEYCDSLPSPSKNCEVWAKQLLVNLGLETLVDQATPSNEAHQQDCWSCGLWVLKWIEVDLRRRRNELPMPKPTIQDITKRVNTFIAKVLQKATPQPAVGEAPEEPKTSKKKQWVPPVFDCLEDALAAAQKCTKCLPTKQALKGCSFCMGMWFEEIRQKQYKKATLKKTLE